MQNNTEPIELIAPRGDADWAVIESLYHDLFPPDERREFSLVKEFYREKSCFRMLVILLEGRAVGFFSLWEFDRFFYGEHFAVDQTLANKGIGSKVLTKLGDICHKPFYLEVETPEDEITTRRVGFYTRNGFELLNRVYIQPPYSADSNELEMRLMVRGASPDVSYEEVEKTIHAQVYGKK